MTAVEPMSRFRETVAKLHRGDAQYFVQLVELLLETAVAARATDVHIQPADDGLHILWRIDGLLQPVNTLPKADGQSVVARLKILSGLLTYQTDTPQEGRIRASAQLPEMRVGVFPGIFGERAAIRIFAAADRLLGLSDLGLPMPIAEKLGGLLRRTTGLILVTGPAGSGKTTTLYACLREIGRRQSARSMVSIEDPVEKIVSGVSQAQIRPAVGFDFPTALRSLMRQDPDVIVVGEIRDPVTAQTAFQAALTGHLILSSFHAGSAAMAVSRLLDMAIEPYVVQSCLLAVLGQRLLRRVCNCPGERSHCPHCSGTGYCGRFPIAELLLCEIPEVGDAILKRAPTSTLETIAVASGMKTLLECARQALEWESEFSAGGEKLPMTDAAEVARVLGCVA